MELDASCEVQLGATLEKKKCFSYAMKDITVTVGEI